MAKTTITTKMIETEGVDGAAEPLPFYKRPFWEIVWNLPMDGALSWQNHKARVYRATEAWTNDVSPEGNLFQAPFDEDTIRNKWGGGRYLIWLYGPPDGRKLVCRPLQLTLDGPPKIAAAGNGAGSSELVTMFREFMDRMSNLQGGTIIHDAMTRALNLQAEGLRSGVNTARAINADGSAQPKSRLDDLFEKFMEAQLLRMMEGPKPDSFRETLEKAMLDKLLNPTSPIEQVSKIVEGIKPLLGLGGNTKTDLGSLANTFMSTLPSLADKAVTGVREWRLGTEATERAVRLQTGHAMNKGDVIDVQPEQPSQTASANMEPKPTDFRPDNSSAQDVSGPTLEWVQLKIVQAIEKDAEAAADWLYDWLEAVAPELNVQLGTQTPQAIMDLFASQPILSKVAKHPSLPKIIEQYLTDAQKAAASKPS